MSDWRLTPDNAALLVVDVQEKLMAAMPRRAETVAACVRLTVAAKILSLPILLTAQYPRGLGPVCPEITTAAPGVMPLEKLAFSCCGAEAFTQSFRQLRRKRVLIAGVEAHVCVQQTVIDLMALDCFPYVCADAVCSRRDLDRDVALARMRDCGAVITTVESAVFELLREAGTDQFKACLPLFK